MARTVILVDENGRRHKLREGCCEFCGESDGWFTRDRTDLSESTCLNAIVCECMGVDKPCSKCTARMATREDGLCEGCAPAGE